MQQSNASWQHTVRLPVGIETDTDQSHEVTLRKMTGKEEAILSDAKMRKNAGAMITSLLTGCITSIDGVEAVSAKVIRQLTSADRNFLLLELRRLTFGDEIETQYRCPYCNNQTFLVDDLATVEVRNMPVNGSIPEISVTLKDGYQGPDSQWHYDLVFRLPTGEDEEAAMNRRDANESRQRDALLARCLVRVGELEPKRIRALGAQILSNLSMADRRLIQKTLDAQSPGPNLVRSIECDRCGEQFKSTLDMTRFFPLE